MSSDKDTGSQLQLVSFLLGKEIFALDVMKIQGVERLSEVTEIPRLPDFVEGVINLRGEIIPIIDLRKRFGLDTKTPDKETRVVLVELRDTVVGLIVDMVFEVFQVDIHKVGQVPRLARTSIDSRFVAGVAEIKEKLVIILEIERLFSDDEVEEISVAS